MAVSTEAHFFAHIAALLPTHKQSSLDTATYRVRIAGSATGLTVRDSAGATLTQPIPITANGYVDFFTTQARNFDLAILLPNSGTFTIANLSTASPLALAAGAAFDAAGDLTLPTTAYLAATFLQGSSSPLALSAISKSVAGNTDVTLTAADYLNPDITLTGAITGNIAVIVPLTAGATYFVFNNTTGAFTVTIKGATGTGIVIATGKRAIVRADGTNVNRWTADA